MTKLLFSVFSARLGETAEVDDALSEFVSAMREVDGIIECHAGPCAARGALADGLTHAMQVLFRDQETIDRYLDRAELVVLQARLDESCNGKSAFLLDTY